MNTAASERSFSLDCVFTPVLLCCRLICRDAAPKPRRGRSSRASPSPKRRSAASGASFLDQLQKDAHASELDHTNTSPLTFAALTLVQFPVCHHLATAMGLPTFLAWMPMLSHVVGFLFGHFVLHSDKWFDVWGETTFFALLVASHKTVAEPNARQCLASALALLWCTRLGLFLGKPHGHIAGIWVAFWLAMMSKKGITLIFS